MSHESCPRQSEFVMPTIDDVPPEDERPETDSRDAILFTFSDSEDGPATEMSPPAGPGGS
jgi:hypothetical protein